MKKNNGFTLIELLVVVIILGILAALAIPMYTSAVEQRKGEACINNMRMIFAAWRIYNLNNAAWDPNDTFQDIQPINQRLGINIEERNFGRNNGNQGAFRMYYNRPLGKYRLTTFRLTGSLSSTPIICMHYSNGTIVAGQTVYYVWTGSWPWLPANG